MLSVLELFVLSVRLLLFLPSPRPHRRLTSLVPLPLSVLIGKVPAAFQLAEKHRDFDSLVELANAPNHGSASKVKLFLDKYGKEFAFPLYRFYLQHGASASSCFFSFPRHVRSNER